MISGGDPLPNDNDCRNCLTYFILERHVRVCERKRAYVTAYIRACNYIPMITIG